MDMMKRQILPPLDPTWMHAVLRHGRLWRRFAVQAIVRETHYRVSFIATITVGIIQLVLSLIPVLLLYSFTEEINGWEQGDVIALSGMYQLSFALLAMCVQTNMNRMSSYIRQGDLDLILIRPVSSQFYVTLRWLKPAEIFNVLIGVVVVLIGLSRSGNVPSPGQIGQAVLLIGCGMVLLTCFWSAAVFLAFWFTSVEPLPMVVRDVMGAGQFPLAFYPTPIRLVFAFIVPVGFATTFPVEALLGRGGWDMVGVGIVLSVVALVLLRAWWKFAVRFYSSAGG
jgi:ABC-2 type transport system permease protein